MQFSENNFGRKCPAIPEITLFFWQSKSQIMSVHRRFENQLMSWVVRNSQKNYDKAVTHRLRPQGEGITFRGYR